MNQEKIGKFIAECRKKKNLTQEELAEKLGVNSRSISRWENGNCLPDLSLLPLISKELNVSINELMTGEYLKKEEYQDKFEENVITTVAEVDTTNKKYNRFMKICISIIVISLVGFLTLIFCNTYTYPIRYKDDSVEVKILSTTNMKVSNLEVRMYNSGNKNDYIITKYKENNEEIGLIFVKSSNTILNAIKQRRMKVHSNDLTNIDYGNVLVDLSHSNIPDKFRIYYTTVSFSQLIDASDKKVSKIIKNSNLVYESSL